MDIVERNEREREMGIETGWGSWLSLSDSWGIFSHALTLYRTTSDCCSVFSYCCCKCTHRYYHPVWHSEAAKRIKKRQYCVVLFFYCRSRGAHWKWKKKKKFKTTLFMGRHDDVSLYSKKKKIWQTQGGILLLPIVGNGSILSIRATRAFDLISNSWRDFSPFPIWK